MHKEMGALIAPQAAPCILDDAERAVLEKGNFTFMGIVPHPVGKSCRALVAVLEYQEKEHHQGGASSSTDKMMYASVRDLFKADKQAIAAKVCEAHETKYLARSRPDLNARTPITSTKTAPASTTAKAGPSLWEKLNNAFTA
jgi:hypothetical protein